MSGRASDDNLALCPECQRLTDACLAAINKITEAGAGVPTNGNYPKGWYEAWNAATKEMRAAYAAALDALSQHRAEHGC
jgi:hypothetical protein